MRIHVSFNLYVPEGVCTFEDLEAWFLTRLDANFKARDLLGLRAVAPVWTLTGVDVQER